MRNLVPRSVSLDSIPTISASILIHSRVPLEAPDIFAFDGNNSFFIEAKALGKTGDQAPAAATDSATHFSDAFSTSIHCNFPIAFNNAIQLNLQANSIAARAQSAFDILTHVLRTESSVTDEDNEQVLSLIADRKRVLREQTANIEAFERSWIAQLQTQTRLKAPVKDDPLPLPAPAAENESAEQSYWRRIRNELQQWFPVTLEELAGFAGMAKGTLVYIDQPTRRPRASTLRKISELHGLARSVIEAFGEGNGRDWLARRGLQALRDGGTSALDRETMAMLYGNRKSEEAVPMSQAQLDAGEYQPPEHTEAQAF